MTRLAAHLDEIASEARTALDRPLTLAELLEVLTWGLQTLDPALVKSSGSLGTARLKARTEDGEQSADGGDAIDELGDAVFTAASDLFADLAHQLRDDERKPPTIKSLLGALADTVRDGPSDLISDVAPSEIRGIDAEFSSKAKNRKVQEGDIVAIPTGDGDFRLAVVLARNRFGLALGLLEGTHALRPARTTRLRPTGHPIHTDEEAVRSGRWQVVGHDENLRSQFPEPEIFHAPRRGSSRSDLGEYGAGETADGTLRKLDRQEAEELGLLDGTYRQVRTHDDLEEWLPEKG
jgi:hypothetical protein